jgi:hypothetical protein
MIAQKTADNVATIKPQVEDDTAPGGYYRLLSGYRKTRSSVPRVRVRWTSASPCCRPLMPARS